MTSGSIDPGTRALILELIRAESLRPTQVLERLLKKDQKLTQVQDALAVLLDSGTIEMDEDRHLHMAGIAA